MKFDILQFVGARKRVDEKNAALNPYNELNRFKTGKFTKQQMNDVLNLSREKISNVQEILLSEMRKDSSVTSDELKLFAKHNPKTWPPEKVRQVVIALNQLRPEIIKLSKQSA